MEKQDFKYRIIGKADIRWNDDAGTEEVVYYHELKLADDVDGNEGEQTFKARRELKDTDHSGEVTLVVNVDAENHKASIDKEPTVDGDFDIVEHSFEIEEIGDPIEEGHGK